MKGRKPVPLKIVKLLGNPGRRPLRNDAPGVGTIGPPPKDMNDVAKGKWVEAASQWSIVLTASDRDALRLYCETWADMINAQIRLDEDGPMIVTPNGLIQRSPWAINLERCREFCRRMLAEFGGSPSSRARVPARDDSDQADPAQKYFG